VSLRDGIMALSSVQESKAMVTLLTGKSDLKVWMLKSMTYSYHMYRHVRRECDDKYIHSVKVYDYA
jgi:hypothetical protein